MGARSHVSTHEYCHASIHVTSSQLGHVSPLSPLLGQPSRHPETSCSDHLHRWAAHISLMAPNLLWFVRPWLADTKLTDGILHVLTSTSVDRHVKSQVISKIERTTNCVMTRHLTQPPVVLQRWWLPYR